MLLRALRTFTATLLLAAFVVSPACKKKEEGATDPNAVAPAAAPANVAQATAVLSHFQAARFNVAPGPQIDAAVFKAASCVGKRIEGIEAAVCQYPDEKAAVEGAKAGREWVKGAVSGTVLQR